MGFHGCVRAARRAAAAMAEECRVKLARESSTEMSTPPPWLSHREGVSMTLMVLLLPLLPGETVSPRLSMTRDFTSLMRNTTSVGSKSSWKVPGA